MGASIRGDIRMVVERTATKTRIEDAATKFHKNGVLIIDWHDEKKETWPEIRFDGDEDAGFKASLSPGAISSFS